MKPIKIDINSAAAEKLVDTVASGVGAVAGGWFRYANAKPKSKALLIEAQAQRDAHDILAGKKALGDDGQLIAVAGHEEHHTALAEISSRFGYQEEKRQRNLSAITVGAKDFLDEDVSKQNVDPDWISRFFMYAQDVSSENMQELWSRILAGEVYRPSSYSLRTLDVLKNLVSNEAELIKKFACFVWDGLFHEGVYKSSQDAPFKYSEFLKLHEIGVISFMPYGTMSSAKIYSSIEDAPVFPIGFVNGSNYLHFHKIPNGQEELRLKVCPLTEVGRELVGLLGDIEMDKEHINLIVEHFKKLGFTPSKDTNVLKTCNKGIT